MSAFNWQTLNYSWRALVGMVITGTTIYVASNLRPVVKPVDIMEIVLGAHERALATAYDWRSYTDYSDFPANPYKVSISDLVYAPATNEFAIRTKGSHTVNYHEATNNPPINNYRYYVDWPDSIDFYSGDASNGLLQIVYTTKELRPLCRVNPRTVTLSLYTTSMVRFVTTPTMYTTTLGTVNFSDIDFSAGAPILDTLVPGGYILTLRNPPLLCNGLYDRYYYRGDDYFVFCAQTNRVVCFKYYTLDFYTNVYTKNEYVVSYNDYKVQYSSWKAINTSIVVVGFTETTNNPPESGKYYTDSTSYLLFNTNMQGSYVDVQYRTFSGMTPLPESVTNALTPYNHQEMLSGLESHLSSLATLYTTNPPGLYLTQPNRMTFKGILSNMNLGNGTNFTCKPETVNVYTGYPVSYISDLHTYTWTYTNAYNDFYKTNGITYIHTGYFEQTGYSKTYITNSYTSDIPQSVNYACAHSNYLLRTDYPVTTVSSPSQIESIYGSYGIVVTNGERYALYYERDTVVRYYTNEVFDTPVEVTETNAATYGTISGYVYETNLVERYKYLYALSNRWETYASYDADAGFTNWTQSASKTYRKRTIYVSRQTHSIGCLVYAPLTQVQIDEVMDVLNAQAAPTFGDLDSLASGHWGVYELGSDAIASGSISVSWELYDVDWSTRDYYNSTTSATAHSSSAPAHASKTVGTTYAPYYTVEYNVFGWFMWLYDFYGYSKAISVYATAGKHISEYTTGYGYEVTNKVSVTVTSSGEDITLPVVATATKGSTSFPNVTTNNSPYTVFNDNILQLVTEDYNGYDSAGPPYPDSSDTGTKTVTKTSYIGEAGALGAYVYLVAYTNPYANIVFKYCTYKFW